MTLGCKKNKDLQADYEMYNCQSESDTELQMNAYYVYCILYILPIFLY